MASKYLQNYPVPDGFYDILHDFAREVIRDQPEDIILYASNYFDSKQYGKNFIYESKYNIKRVDQKTHKEYHNENQRKFNENNKKEEPKINIEEPEERLQTVSSHATEKAAAQDYVSNLLNRSLQSEIKYDQEDIVNDQSDSMSSKLIGELYVRIVEAKDLNTQETNSDTYCVVFFSNKPTKIIKTPNSNNAQNPQWDYQDKLVLQIEREEIFDLQLVIQVFNSENGKTLIGETTYETLEMFETPDSKMIYEMKLKNSEGESGNFGVVVLELQWIQAGGVNVSNNLVETSQEN